MRRPILSAALGFALGWGGFSSGTPLPAATTNPKSVDELFAFALTRSLVEPKDRAHLHLLGDGPEIVVRSDIPNSPFRIVAEALPVVPGKTLLLLSADQIRARAAWQGDVYYLAVDELEFTEGEAAFFIGVGVTTSPERPVSCCCSTRVRYSRIDGVWVYRGANEFRCG